MIIILFGAGTKTYLLCRSDRHAFKSAFCSTLPVGCLKFCFSLEVRSLIWQFTIFFQDDRTESSTISRLAHYNAYWSTASHKSDKFLSQSTLHGSLYFEPSAIRSFSLESGIIERSPVITCHMVDINGLSCYIHTEMDCCETGDNPSLTVLMKNWKSYSQ